MRHRLFHRPPVALTFFVVSTLLDIFVSGGRSHTFGELSSKDGDSFPFSNTKVVSSSSSTFSRTSIIWQRGGGYPNESDEYNEHDEYEPLPRSRRSPTTRSHPHFHRPTIPSRHRPGKHRSALNRTSKLAKQTLKLASSTTLKTLKGTGKAAYYLTAPKYVTRDEVYGLWRLDQVLLDDIGGDTCAANVQLTRKGDVITQYNHEEEDSAVYHFRSRTWPRSCAIEFQAKAFQGRGDLRPVSYYYKGVFRRKMADPSVIKIVGKIYELKKGRFWKGGGVGVEVGSFVARRRIAGCNFRKQNYVIQGNHAYDGEDSYGEGYYDVSEDYDSSSNGEEEYDNVEA